MVHVRSAKKTFIPDRELCLHHVMSEHHIEATVIDESRSEPPAAKCCLLASISDGGHVTLTSLLTCRRALRAGVLGV
jgi:hypothetical protein